VEEDADALLAFQEMEDWELDPPTGAAHRAFFTGMNRTHLNETEVGCADSSGLQAVGCVDRAVRLDRPMPRGAALAALWWSGRSALVGVAPTLASASRAPPCLFKSLCRPRPFTDCAVCRQSVPFADCAVYRPRCCRYAPKIPCSPPPSPNPPVCPSPPSLPRLTTIFLRPPRPPPPRPAAPPTATPTAIPTPALRCVRPPIRRAPCLRAHPPSLCISLPRECRRRSPSTTRP
jgi:hypothetical protein